MMSEHTESIIRDRQRIEVAKAEAASPRGLLQQRLVYALNRMADGGRMALSHEETPAELRAMVNTALVAGTGGAWLVAEAFCQANRKDWLVRQASDGVRLGRVMAQEAERLTAELAG